MARRGLRVHAVPSARAGQRPDAPLRRDAPSRVVTGGFVMAVIAAVLIIVVAAPEYGGPGVHAAGSPSRPAPSPSASPLAAQVDDDRPASAPPEELDGYRWPVQGRILRYYDAWKQGLLSIDGRRIHEAIDVGWFCGARVQAAHAGRVLAAGRDYLAHVGLEGGVRKLYRRLEREGRMKRLPIAVVIDDGNGYRSVYSHLDGVRVKAGQKVRRGEVIGNVGSTGGAPVCMLQYELVRMDGGWMRVALDAVRDRGLPDEGFPRYARERVDPLRVLRLDGKRAPLQPQPPPVDAPRLDES